jgi:sugar phosphate isomerase/epimerase
MPCHRKYSPPEVDDLSLFPESLSATHSVRDGAKPYFTYDITHISTYGYDIIPVFLRYLKTGRLRNVHLSDYSTWNEKSHLGIGRGELPVVRLLNTMRRMGFDEKVTLEMQPQELPRKTEWLQRVLTYAADYLKLHLTRG